MINPPESPTQTATAWHEGWWQGAQHLPSPNFGPRPVAVTIDLVVLHCISLPPGVYGGPEVQHLFTNMLDWNAHPYFQSIQGMQVSSHFFITRVGQVFQFVSCDARAWHAGQSHYRGRDNCNDDSIGIELEGTDTGVFTPSQYESLQGLCAAIAKNYPIEHIAGHEHIAPGRKSDPGRGLEWSTLKKWPTMARWKFPS